MDDPVKPTEKEPPTLFQRPFLQVAFAIVVGMFGATGVQLTFTDARSDAYTGKDALELEIRMMTAVDDKIRFHISQFTKHELQGVKNEIMAAIEHLQYSMPSQALRERVQELEDFARQQDTSFKPPTRKWQ